MLLDNSTKNQINLTVCTGGRKCAQNATLRPNANVYRCLTRKMSENDGNFASLAAFKQLASLTCFQISLAQKG